MPQDKSRWTVKPGSFDSLNSSLLFSSDNHFGIPDLKPTPLAALPQRLIAYRMRIRSAFNPGELGVHFWLDDYRFETVWNRPQKALQALARFKTLLTPDFSIYRDWPRAMQIWNTYRSRWCGCLWQAAGYTVIPSVSWGPPDTFDFCFIGLPHHSLLAVSGVGARFDMPRQRDDFMIGFAEMVDRLQPTAVLAYGPIPEAAHSLARVVTYPTRWQTITAEANA